MSIEGQDWQSGLIGLRHRGWEAEDIDAACEALAEACSEGALAGWEIGELDAGQVAKVLGFTLAPSECAALLCVAREHGRQDAACEALRRALLDLDGFVASGAAEPKLVNE